jgi:hypothetical protein
MKAGDLQSNNYLSALCLKRTYTIVLNILFFLVQKKKKEENLSSDAK